MIRAARLLYTYAGVSIARFTGFDCSAMQAHSLLQERFPGLLQCDESTFVHAVGRVQVC